jgi:hypothetical protein
MDWIGIFYQGNNMVKTLTYRQVDSILKWSATILILIGAVLTSLAVDPLNIYVMNVGTLIWLIWALRIRDNALIVVNAGLLVIYLMGVGRALLQ